MTLTPEDLQLLDTDMHWRVVPGNLRLWQESRREISLQGVLKVTAN